MKKLLTVLLIATLSLFAVSEVRAATNGDVTGTFSSTGYNNASSIDSANLVINSVTQASGQAEVAVVTTALTPQLDYYVDFDISDLDGFDDIVVEFQFYYYDSETETSHEVDFDNNADTETDAYKILWYGANGKSDSETAQTGFVFDNNTTSWEFNPEAYTGTDFASTVTGTDTTKTFKIYFTPSKVAPASSTGNWVAAVKVYDFIGESGWDFAGSTPDDTQFGSLDGYTMDWYGEITDGGSQSVTWASATAGMDYGTGADSQQAYTGMTYISNSNYYQQVKASEVWTQTSGDVAGDATLKTLFTGGNQFGLRAYTFGTYVGTEIDTQSPAYTQVGHVSLATIGGVYYARTGEAGEGSEIRLQLSLSDNFQNGSYEGTITLGITNVV